MCGQGKQDCGQELDRAAGGSLAGWPLPGLQAQGAAMAESQSLADLAIDAPPRRDELIGAAADADWLASARSRTFAAMPHQVAAARRFLAGLLADWCAKDDALVCLSELATNALLHSRSASPGGTFTVHAHPYPGAWRVGVSDKGGSWQPRAETVGTQCLTSRGLAIVAALAVRVGIEPYGQYGRLVWFEVADGAHAHRL
jgi:serine/threonine-protein kinase RsbW